MKTTRRALVMGASAAPFLSANSVAKAPKTAWNPKISENLADVEPATLRWLKQLGCKHVIFQGTSRVDSSQKGYWSVDDVRPHKKNCDDAGMILESMMIPIEFYRKARLGEPGRDREIDNVIRTIQAAGKAGVPMMEWRFWPDFYWDERVGYYAVKGRGEAGFRGFDYSRVADKGPFPEIGEVSEGEMWRRFLYFTKPVVSSCRRSEKYYS